MHMRVSTPLVLIFLVALGATEAAAHYTFILPQVFRVTAGETLTIGFHSGDGFPESAAILKRLQEPTIRTERGAIKLGGLKEDGKRLVASTVVPTSSHIIVTALNPPAVEQMKPDSFEKYLEEEGLGHIVRARAARGESGAPGRERYSMYAKAVLATGTPGDGYRSVAGLALEIIPEKDPYRLQSGEMLPVRVLFRGKPAADLQLTAASTAEGFKTRVVGTTDAEGRVTVPVSRGQWRLHTILMERVTEAEIDWESTWTTLTFEVS
jgi:uncharacterized GH25 family protein